jgi:hypothetical protein
MEVQLLDVSYSQIAFRLEYKKLGNVRNKMLGTYINLISMYFWWLINLALQVSLTTVGPLPIL